MDAWPTRAYERLRGARRNTVASSRPASEELNVSVSAPRPARRLIAVVKLGAVVSLADVVCVGVVVVCVCVGVVSVGVVPVPVVVVTVVVVVVVGVVVVVVPTTTVPVIIVWAGFWHMNG
jgi:hypothetical protein